MQELIKGCEIFENLGGLSFYVEQQHQPHITPFKVYVRYGIYTPFLLMYRIRLK